MLSLPVIVFVAFSFVPGLPILAVFFNSVLRESSPTATYYRSAFVIAFSGYVISVVFTLAAMYAYPQLVPKHYDPEWGGTNLIGAHVMDEGIVLAAIAWVLLLRYYCGTSTLVSLPVAAIAAIVYVVITAAASGFSFRFLQLGFFGSFS